MGGGAPEVPKEQRELAATQERIAKEEYEKYKKPGLEELRRWSLGGEPIPARYKPDFGKLLTEAGATFEKMGKGVETAYKPSRAAIEKYYGPALMTPAIERIEKEAARAKEETAGIRGLPSVTAKRLEEIETFRGAERINTERIGNLAKAGATVALEAQLGTEKANLAKALGNFELAAKEQEAMYEPELRKWAASVMIGGGVNPEAKFESAARMYDQMYQRQLQAYQINKQEEMAWIGAFSNIAGQAIGMLAGPAAAAAPVFTPSTSIIPKIAPTQSAFL